MSDKQDADRQVAHMEMLNKEMIHTLSRTKLDGARFHYGAQNSMQFKAYGLWISGIFHLIFLDCH